jgi:adenosylmethionine-8-amino-7-oxononanoate aminotransferase
MWVQYSSAHKRNKKQESYDALQAQIKTIIAFYLRTLVQGAAGMMHEPEALAKLKFAMRNQVPIADEVMTGFGKTGKTFAMDYVNAQPDMMCLKH